MSSTRAQQACSFPGSLSLTVLMLHVFILGSKLNLDDLLVPLASQSSTLLSLKMSTKILASASSSKAKTLSAPLPHRIQERLDREAAYEQTKEEVDKWSGTMKRIREVGRLIHIV
jgi:U3 small nucleolar RNA-associated protein 14